MKDDFSIKGEVIAALETVIDPQAGNNVVEAHMVEAVDVAAGVVDITLTIQKGRSREERFALEDDIYDKVEAIGGVTEVKIKAMSPEAIQREASGEKPAPVPQPAPSAGAQPQAVPPSAPVEGVGKVIAVASGKGGVGKSTVAVNLALALKKLDYRVGLLDVDIYGPSLPTLLGVMTRPEVRDRRIVPIEVEGLRLMSLGFLMEEDTPVIWRGPIVTGIIRQFLRDVDWSGLDYLIIDMPPGMGDAQLALAQTVPVDGAVIVSTPSELALIDAARGLQMFKTLNIDVLGFVENMSKFVSPSGEVSYIFGEGTVVKEAERLEVPYLGDIPIDTAIRLGGDTGKPIVLADPEGESSLAFVEIARKIAAAKPVGEQAAGAAPEKKKGLFSFLKG
jgi:ATP-binding protein involved in chromosome partitioning